MSMRIHTWEYVDNINRKKELKTLKERKNGKYFGSDETAVEFFKKKRDEVVV